MTFTPRDWTDGELVTAAKMEDLETRLSNYSDSAGSPPGYSMPKVAWTMPNSQATQQSAANFFARVVLPYTGTIDRIMVFCTTVGTATTIELGIYDTTATTRNRLAVATGVSLSAASYIQGTVSLAVTAGTSVDFGYASNNGSASFAGNTMSTSGNMALLPSGWCPVTLGGKPQLSYFISGITSLASTYSEASFSLDTFVPLILARYV